VLVLLPIRSERPCAQISERSTLLTCILTAVPIISCPGPSPLYRPPDVHLARTARRPGETTPDRPKVKVRKGNGHIAPRQTWLKQLSSPPSLYDHVLPRLPLHRRTFQQTPSGRHAKLPSAKSIPTRQNLYLRKHTSCRVPVQPVARLFPGQRIHRRRTSDNPHPIVCSQRLIPIINTPHT
jgi:hypothetical protein